MKKQNILIGEIQNKTKNSKQNKRRNITNIKNQATSSNYNNLIEKEVVKNKEKENVNITDIYSSTGQKIKNEAEEENKESKQINKKIRNLKISKQSKPKKRKKKKNFILKKLERKQKNINWRITNRNKLNSLNEVQRFYYALNYVKQHLSKLARKYRFPEYLIIDLLMMAIAKIIPKSYTLEYYYDKYLSHLKENLKKRYNLKSYQNNDLDNVIQELQQMFQEKFHFSLFRCEMRNRFNYYLPRIYDEFKEMIIENITKFVSEFDYRQKGILWLFNYWISNISQGIWSGTLKFIKNGAKIAFSLNEVNEEIIKDTIINSGIGHFGDYFSLKRGNLHNLQKNQGQYYDFWLEIPIIQEILEEVRIPNFSEDIHKFREKFDISKNPRNILEFIGLEYLLKRESNPNEFLDNILISGSKKFLNHQRILRKSAVNPFIREELNAQVTEIKEEVFMKYNWFIDTLRTNFNAELDDLTENGKLYYVELNGDRYYIEIFPWFVENILVDSDSNRIVIFLFHPKFKFLRESFYDSDSMKGLIAFDGEGKVFSIGFSSFYENLDQLFQEIEKRGLIRTSIELPCEEEINDEEEYEEIYSNLSLSQISSPDGEGGNADGDGSDIWDLFKWNAEKWEKFQYNLNSDSSMCIFLKNRDNKFIAEKTIMKLISTEFNRKYGNTGTSHDILNLADFDNSITTISSEKVKMYAEVLNQAKSRIISMNLILSDNEYTDFIFELDDLMTQIDLVRGAKKKLIFFLCDSKLEIQDLFIEVKQRITSTHLLEFKYSNLTDTLLIEIINELSRILSIPSYNWKENHLIPEDVDIDEIFTSLDEIKTLYYRKITDDPNWIYIKPSWSNEDEEHLKMKLLAYNYLKRKLRYQNEDIFIEEMFDSEGNCKAVPDINVNRDIWIEIETLLGNTDLSLLITQKFKRKKELIKYFKEFWLILPNFEIFMHKTKIRTFIKQLYSLFEKEVSIKIFGCDFIRKTLIPRFQLKKSNNLERN